MRSRLKSGKKGRFIILSSPSGGGKSTIIKQLLANHSDLVYSVSCTTRPPRKSEIQGQSYWFMDVQEFVRFRDRGDLLEWEEVYGDFYGTPRQPAEEAIAAGHDVIFDLDVKGALKVKANLPDTLTIFLAPPSFEILEQRLRDRGTESEEELKVRLALARCECEQSGRFDHVVINGDLQETVRSVEHIITNQ